MKIVLLGRTGVIGRQFIDALGPRHDVTPAAFATLSIKLGSGSPIRQAFWRATSTSENPRTSPKSKVFLP